jgi:predicted Abi (CAAX) family protease
MKREIVYAIIIFIVLFVVAFFFSILSGMGKAESLHEPSSLWMYVRRGLMIIFAIVIPWIRKKDSFLALGWKPPIKWIAIAIASGFVIGFSNKGGFKPNDPTAILLALFHTFATELFFRRYLLKTFSESLKSFWLPIFLSSFLYGIFYLTVWTTWGLPLIGKIIFVFLFSGLGILFSYSYKKSGSFLVPWMMHFLGVLNYKLLF